MFKLKRNQVIITALVVMIAVAGYLNYADSGVYIPEGFAYNPDGSISAIIADLADAEIVPADMIIAPPAPMADADADNIEATFVSATVQDDSTFFVHARLEREQARARQREMLFELINNENLTQDVRAESANEMLTMQRRIEKESAAEALIESRGFDEVFVRIGDNYVDVIVNKSSLTDSELAQIEDVVRRKTGVESSQIRITPMNRE